jgi:hypothetical protein
MADPRLAQIKKMIDRWDKGEVDSQRVAEFVWAVLNEQKRERRIAHDEELEREKRGAVLNSAELVPLALEHQEGCCEG